MKTALKKYGWLILPGLLALAESGILAISSSSFTRSVTSSIERPTDSEESFLSRIHFVREDLGETEPFETVKMHLLAHPKLLNQECLARITKFEIRGARWTPFYKNMTCDWEVHISPDQPASKHLRSAPASRIEATLEGSHHLKGFGLIGYKAAKQDILEGLIKEVQDALEP